MRDLPEIMPTQELTAYISAKHECTCYNIIIALSYNIVQSSTNCAWVNVTQLKPYIHICIATFILRYSKI